ncbi:MAG: Pr6Pr family membrane protein [Clostridia bacterium]|nr:Pr6Pr family membrane protein [Clostridia bacterium]
MKIKRIIRSVIRFAIALTLICCACIGYWDSPEYMTEYTFLSNFIVGIFLAASALFQLIKKSNIPAVLHLCSVIMLMIGMGICLSDISGFNFSGIFLFLHIINPLLVLADWFLFVPAGAIKKPQSVLFVTVLPIVYLVFLFVNGYLTGNYLYPIFDVTYMGVASVMTTVIVALIATLLFAYLLYFLNKFFYMRNSKKSNTKI